MRGAFNSRSAGAVVLIAATLCSGLRSARLTTRWILSVGGRAGEANTFTDIGAYAAIADETLCRASGTTLPLEARVLPR
eukprot:323268-Pyramimonas_sp.AAC.1